MTSLKESLENPTLEDILDILKKSIENTQGMPIEEMTEEDISFLYELGYNLYHAEDFPAAETIFRRLILAKSFDKRFWQGLASTLFCQKKYEEALMPFSFFALLDPKSPVPHFHAAECFFSLQRKEEGLKALEAAKLRDTQDIFKEQISLFEISWNQSEEEVYI